MGPETAHEETVRALSLAQRSITGRAFLRRLAGPLPALPVDCAGLRFPNPLGLAGGFDKDARVARGLALLGFGHIEVGTLTPRAQAGNPRPRIFRLAEDEALINRMGFPNGGLEAVLPRLRALRQRELGAVLGVSLGKQKETALEDAAADYLAVMRGVYSYADYLAVNISSPNTPGLRELQGGRYLDHLLATLVAEGRGLSAGDRPKPLFVKIAPDLSWEEIDEVLAAIETAGADGLIATNTTLRRDGLHSEARAEAGGLSGAPLRERSRAVVAFVSKQTGGRLPIIGVGGVSTAEDIKAMLDAGATLVQLYTALVYGGPGLPGRLLRALAATA
jgi:dihydroorotate dehydrogenase